MNGVFVDSSVFLKVLEGDTEAKNAFTSLYKTKKLYRNAIVYREVIYVWIKLTTGKKSFELKKMPDSIRATCSESEDVKAFLDLAHPLEIEDLTEDMMKKYGLLSKPSILLFMVSRATLKPSSCP